jgi:nucleotide-binding universal stress UspA family protein
MNILIAVDGSPCTKRALAYLAAHDEWFGPQHHYTVLTVTPAVPPGVKSMVDRGLLQAHYGDEAEAVFQPIRAFFLAQGITADYIGKVGHAAETICELADSSSCDLLVLGSHGNGAVANLVLGSTATKVLAGCKTPVLLIR